MAAAIDTLKFSERLSDGGFTQEQAKAAANALAEALNTEIATRADLEALRLQIEGRLTELRLQLESKFESKIAELDRKITETRLGLEGKISDARTEILRWTIGMIGFQTLVVLGALFALLKLFIK